MKKAVIIVAAAILILVLLASVGVSVFAFYVGDSIDYQADERLLSASKSSNTTEYFAYDTDGNLVRVSKEAAGAAKTWVSLDEVSDTLIDAFISAEDRDFYKHNGVNVKRTLAALANYFLHFTSNFGGSTITQQVIKNISGDNEHTLRRKFSEIMRSIHLDSAHSKEEILEAYVNVIPMSGNVYGVREASEVYFNKSPADLTLTEAATIVGIANAPGRYDPIKHPDACLEKRNRVLYAMKQNGCINKEEYEAAVTRPLQIRADKLVAAEVSNWFVESAREEVISDLSAKYDVSRLGAILMLGGAKVILTLNTDVQEIMEAHFENIDNFPDGVNDGLKYSMVVCDSLSGDVVGIIGGVGEKQGNRLYNYATALHPPASTLKPLALYAPMIDEGAITWSTIVEDAPKEMRNGGAVEYPKNSPDVYEGRITVCDAVKKSKNTVAYELYLERGRDRVYRDLQEKLGFDTLVSSRETKNGTVSDLGAAPLAFGQLTDGVSLVDLTHAYTAFPSGGELRGGRMYYGVFQQNGEVLLDNAMTAKRVFKSSTASLMNKLLSEVAESGTARSITLKESVDTAAKTGTSSSNRDKLLVGYTPYFTAGIWCGYSDGSRGVYAQSPTHIEIWDQVMREIHEKASSDTYSDTVRSFSNEGIVMSLYCRQSGSLARGGCISSGNAEYGYFISDNMPVQFCPVHESE